jgi:hypothetical protein
VYTLHNPETAKESAMKKTIRLVIVLALTLCTIATGANNKPDNKPCTATKLAECPDTGCGDDFDSNLNLQKNIRSDTGTATTRSLAFMKNLADPKNFTEGGSRTELKDLGEGQKISVVAYLLIAKAEPGGESCNCHLKTVAETDNHLVLVEKATVDQFPPSAEDTDTHVSASREEQSETAEFTPRVRLAHPHFTRETMQPMINRTPKRALLVRVTGLLLFDSEHFVKHPLTRVNNWEIHPVLKMEFCTTGNSCTADSNRGWKSVDDLP